MLLVAPGVAQRGEARLQRGRARLQFEVEALQLLREPADGFGIHDGLGHDVKCFGFRSARAGQRLRADAGNITKPRAA